MFSSVRSLVPLSLLALAAARESGSPLDSALSYLPSFAWPSGPSAQLAFDSNPSLEYAQLASYAANYSGAAGATQWTYPPQCLSAETEPEPFCVFTSHTFGGGRGVALVTTPSEAEKFIKMHAFRDKRVPWNANVLKEGIMEERAIPGAGRGMVARQALAPGDNLYTFTPILLLHPDADELGEERMLAMYKQAVRSLPAASQRLFWDLGAHQDADKVDPAQDRIDTNAFGFDLHDLNYFVVNPEIARLNHDCRPNAVYFLDNVTMTQYVHVVRPVSPGEQLTISYMDGSFSRAERQRKLHSNWGFRCSCSACTQHPRLTGASDARLAEMEELTDLLVTDGEDLGDPQLTSEKAIHAAETLVSLYEQERYFSAMSEPLVLASMAHSAAGHFDKARAYGRRALVAAMIEDGFYHDTIPPVKQLADDPRKHWSWRRRKISVDARAHKAVCGCGSQKLDQGPQPTMAPVYTSDADFDD